MPYQTAFRFWTIVVKSIFFRLKLPKNCVLTVFYYHTKTPIDFWYRRRLNLKSIIQLSETLLVEVTETHNIYFFFYFFH